MGLTLAAAELLRNELLLFAAIGLLLGGLDDLAIDGLYATRRLWRSLTIYSRMPRMTACDLPPPGRAGPIAVFVPAWDEGDVIGPMLRACLHKWRDEDVHIFVGAYPNDPVTLERVGQVMAGPHGARVSLVLNPRPGPTTKADCLNQLWGAMRAWEEAQGREMLAVILHDAEDVVHRDALRLIGLLAPRFGLVQLPVLPLASTRSRWIAGHYCDEFAEHHGKSLAVREALGAALPSAGVGCGFNRRVLGRIAAARAELPFDPDSLTEDYELGLRIGEAGDRGVLVRMRDDAGELIATREYFPDTLGAAVRQKARWTVGIALAGWDRMGWSGSWHERWMRLRDRRAALAALVLLAAYLGLLMAGLVAVAELAGRASSPLPWPLSWLLTITGFILGWRLLVRMIFVWRAYGWWEALLSVPRSLVANIIAMLAVRRAVDIYVRHLRGQRLVWDKTTHRFPDAAEPSRS
ncbi:putative bacteriophage N4 adsorption protein B [Sphingobium sp. SYK-6]|uniref:glycosyl transferase family protein n=1 Tax=Sphingobium sp. (strain NBRC 103272 / SYK-6) TaxID=627192 RepID=UPI0002277623|nr:glycosyl transferase family protein [Sphingobium sp. SYK-6]BAK67835.1 putative bacteriophage N4 adsorption protein B [Sphingobium sp. SYK-6]